MKAFVLVAFYLLMILIMLKGYKIIGEFCNTLQHSF
ncbi:MAG: hypothetical protein JWN78_1398 [Bacteroidota bacterium]|nr:hypothetical protein [Bacteroidota bacterium]